MAGPRTYVVIGCGGFIGSHVLDRLLPRRDVRIVGFDPDDHKIAQHLDRPNLELHRTHIGAPGTLALLAERIASADAVINLAAICNPSQYNTRPLRTIYANFMDVLPIVEMCAEHKRWLIHYSTSEVYGRTISSYVSGDDYSDPALYELSEDETPLIMGPIRNQRWTYATAKQLMERVIYAWHKEHGLAFTVIRPMNFFGPRMDFIPGRDGDGVPRVLACFMSALLDGQPMQLVDGGHARRTILSIHDAVDALELILDQPERAQGEIFNIGTRMNEVTIRELAERMRETYARVAGDPRYHLHPIVETTHEAFYGEGYEDCDRRVPDNSKAERLLGWRPWRDLSTILTETVTHYYQLYGKPAEVVTAA
jgi:UDP-apiose/xylose synthase